MEEREKGKAAVMSGIFSEFGGIFRSHPGDLD